MTDYAPVSGQHPDKIFQWVDEDGIRCGPRHKTVKSAVTYFKRCNHWLAVDVDGLDGNDRRQWYGFSKQREDYPSQKKPIQLQIGEWSTREMTTEEQETFDQVMDLMDKGWV